MNGFIGKEFSVERWIRDKRERRINDFVDIARDMISNGASDEDTEEFLIECGATEKEAYSARCEAWNEELEDSII